MRGKRARTSKGFSKISASGYRRRGAGGVGGPHTHEPIHGAAARDCFIADAATERRVPLWLLSAAKRKPVLAGKRQLDDRSWVRAGLTMVPLVSAMGAGTGSIPVRFIIAAWLPRRVA